MSARMDLMRHWRRESLIFENEESAVEAGSLAIERNEYSPGRLVAEDGTILSDIGVFYEVCFDRMARRLEEKYRESKRGTPRAIT